MADVYSISPEKLTFKAIFNILKERKKIQGCLILPFKEFKSAGNIWIRKPKTRMTRFMVSIQVLGPCTTNIFRNRTWENCRKTW